MATSLKYQPVLDLGMDVATVREVVDLGRGVIRTDGDDVGGGLRGHQVGEHLAQREDAEDDRQQVEPARERINAEGEPHRARALVDPRHADQHAEQTGNQPAHEGAAAQRRDHHESEEREGEVLEGSELQAELGERRR